MVGSLHRSAISIGKTMTLCVTGVGSWRGSTGIARNLQGCTLDVTKLDTSSQRVIIGPEIRFRPLLLPHRAFSIVDRGSPRMRGLEVGCIGLLP